MADDFYCDEVLSGRTPVDVVIETDRVLAYHHTNPHWVRHVVVIPKTHVTDLLAVNKDLLEDLMDVVRQVAYQMMEDYGGCHVVTNLGKYQDSKHLHWHVGAGPRLT